MFTIMIILNSLHFQKVLNLNWTSSKLTAHCSTLLYIYSHIPISMERKLFNEPEQRQSLPAISCPWNGICMKKNRSKKQKLYKFPFFRPVCLRMFVLCSLCSLFVALKLFYFMMVDGWILNAKCLTFVTNCNNFKLLNKIVRKRWVDNCNVLHSTVTKNRPFVWFLF